MRLIETLFQIDPDGGLTFAALNRQAAETAAAKQREMLTAEQARRDAEQTARLNDVIRAGVRMMLGLESCG